MKTVTQAIKFFKTHFTLTKILAVIAVSSVGLLAGTMVGNNFAKLEKQRHEAQYEELKGKIVQIAQISRAEGCLSGVSELVTDFDVRGLSIDSQVKVQLVQYCLSFAPQQAGQ